MPEATTIQEFHTLLNSDKESTELEALRALMSIEEPEDVTALVEKERAPYWTNWS